MRTQAKSPTLPTPFHHEFPAGRDVQSVLDELAPGIAVSLQQFPPGWDVCVRRKAGTTGTEYFVTERRRGQRPLRISQLFDSEQEAVELARLIHLVWRLEKFQIPTWPWQ